MNESVQKLLKDRYLLSKENTWEDIALRVSSIYPPIYQHILNKEFVPSSPTLMNANTNGERKGTLSSCFILNLEDSIEGIFNSLKDAALVTKAAGGVGHVYSVLRSEGENINSLQRPSSGPIPFMYNFNTMLDTIQQGGVRRGAGMGQFDIRHPSVLKVIREKSRGDERLNRLNISIRIDDEFYKTLKENPKAPFYVKNVNNSVEFVLEDNGKQLTHEDIWQEIIDNAWKSAEPGIFNSDIAFRQCTVTNLSLIVASNPCAEFVNIPNSSCDLASINLAKCVALISEGKYAVDYAKIVDITRKGTRFLDAIIDINDYPLQSIKETTEAIRPIGLGVMGWAHMLFLLGIPFNSKRAIDLADSIMWLITVTSMFESMDIAQEEGSPYDAFDYDLFVKANERIINKLVGNSFRELTLDNLKNIGVRNSCFTSIAPTGSISFIAETSSGIEPVYALVYSRRIEKLNNEYDTIYIIDPIFEKYLRENFDSLSIVPILEKVSENKGSCQGIEEIPIEDQKIFVTANDLTPMEHLESLAAFAVNTSLSVSKTINMPNSATRQDISDVYLRAHELGIIGVTVFRDGCRKGILSTTKDIEHTFSESAAPKRPKALDAVFYPVTIHGTNFGIIVGLYEEKPYEIFAIANPLKNKEAKGKIVKIKKGVFNFTSENYEIENIGNINQNEKVITILASMLLRHGASLKYVIHTISKLSSGLDFIAAMNRVLKKYIKDGEIAASKCPKCNGNLIFESGCTTCIECGYSGCN